MVYLSDALKVKEIDVTGKVIMSKRQYDDEKKIEFERGYRLGDYRGIAKGAALSVLLFGAYVLYNTQDIKHVPLPTNSLGNLVLKLDSNLTKSRYEKKPKLRYKDIRDN